MSDDQNDTTSQLPSTDQSQRIDGDIDFTTFPVPAFHNGKFIGFVERPISDILDDGMRNIERMLRGR